MSEDKLKHGVDDVAKYENEQRPRTARAGHTFSRANCKKYGPARNQGSRRMNEDS